MWRADEWFMDLPTDARLFWIYLFTNPSASICGMYQLPTRTMAFESGLPHDRVLELLQQFAAQDKCYYENGTVWVVRMRENQHGGKLSKPQEIGIETDIAKVKPSPLKNAYLKHYGYPIDTLPIGYESDADTLSTPADTLCIPPTTLRYDTHTIRNDTLPASAEPAAPAPTPAPKKARKENPHYELARAIGEVCGMPLKPNEGRLLREAQQMHGVDPPATPAEVRDKFGVQEDGLSWWYRDDWRGQKGQRPTPAQVRENWGKWQLPPAPVSRGNNGGIHVGVTGTRNGANREPTEAEQEQWAEFYRKQNAERAAADSGTG
jgi:hypothetical protein